MQQEKRRHYRVQSGSGDNRVTVLGQGQTVAGAHLDTSVGGVGVRFLAADCPALMVGQQVWLGFSWDGLKAPLEFAATVCNRHEEPGTRRYGFRFVDTERVQRELLPPLMRQFNRRAMYRVKGPSAEPVEVALRARGQRELPAAMADISETGIGVLVSAAGEQTLVNVVQLQVSIALPGIAKPVTLESTICNRSLADGANKLRYGIAFDFDNGQEATRQRAAITNFVMEQQRDMLRNRQGRVDDA